MEDHIDILEYYKKANKAAERKEAFNFFETKYVEHVCFKGVVSRAHLLILI